MISSAKMSLWQLHRSAASNAPRVAVKHRSCHQLRPLALLPGHRCSLSPLPPRQPCTRRTARQARSRGMQCRASQGPSKFSVLPAGQRQARVTLPGCLVSVDAAQAVGDGQAQAIDWVTAAVSAGATGVLLYEGGQGGGGELYDVACVLREALRGRVPLLLVDRTDIAAAAEADGVLLTSRGVPTAVARRLVGGANALVGRLVDSPDQAVEAAADGANLVVLQAGAGSELCSPEQVSAAKQQRGGAIPVFVDLPAEAAASPQQLQGLGADGVCCSLAALQGTGSGGSPAAAVQQVIDALTATPGAPPAAFVETAPERERDGGLGTIPGSSPQLAGREDLVEQHRRLLSRILAALKETSPELDEISLLEEALLQLDELFLMVVVGEFNSGKSAVINSLLGGRFLNEGILPTTNEISVLKHAPDGKERTVQEADGMYTRYLPSPLLRDVSIVDTPGTNVILERQQRLTEEYVPRSDLVLFVMSADRPFTESEVGFLKYIRQWGKKVVFVVNKVDILTDEAEVAEVTSFVSDNVSRLLGLETPQVLPVSARLALGAKSNYNGAGSMPFASLSNGSELASDAQWQSSRFGDLERFVFDFLNGGKGGGESSRLKLQTPLFIADALLNAAGQQLEMEMASAKQELDSVRLVRQQLSRFRRDMERDGAVQRSEVGRLVGESVAKAEQLVDDTLQLSNLDAIKAYMLGGKEEVRQLPVNKDFEAGVVSNGLSKLRELIAEHDTWLDSNCLAQLEYYSSFAESHASQLAGRGADAASPAGDLPSSSASANAAGALDSRPARTGNVDLTSPEERRKWRTAHALSDESKGGANGSLGLQSSTDVVAQLEPRSAAARLENELREAVLGTAGTAAGATALSVMATWVLPTTWEDLTAMALGGFVAYTSVLNLPLRRADTKKKMADEAAAFLKDIESRMERELAAELDMTQQAVEALVAPLEQHAQREVERVEAAEQRRAALAAELEVMRRRTAAAE